MGGKYWLVSLLVFVLWFGGSFLVNAVFLINEWSSVGEILRGWEPRPGLQYTELQLYHLTIISFACYALATVWMFRHFSFQGSWLRRGAIYGLGIAFLTIIPMRILNYSTLDFKGGGTALPSPVIIKEMIGWTIMLILIGIVIAWCYRGEAASASGGVDRFGG